MATAVLRQRCSDGTIETFVSYFSPKILREGSQLHPFAHDSILRHEVVRYRAIFVFDDAIAFEGIPPRKGFARVS
tara:strand:+ start:2197 stop:2421 length:225 start_codon:yes stop_codon:yes gene_type:complete